MKRLIGTLALVGTTAIASTAFGQEIQLGVAGRCARRSRAGCSYRERRLSITPTFGVTLQDEFSRELMVGARIEYNFTDWLALGVWGAGTVAHVNTSLTDQISQNSAGGTPNVPVASRFAEQIGRIDWMSDLHLTFIPLRGKFALFQNLVADIDFFLFGGVAFVGVEERANYDGNISGPSSATTPDGVNQNSPRVSRIAPAPTFGAGLNFFINRFLSFNFEYRATPFAWNTSGTDENSTLNRCGPTGTGSCSGYSDIVATQGTHTTIDANDRLFHFNQMVNFGVTVYLPNAPRISQ